MGDSFCQDVRLSSDSVCRLNSSAVAHGWFASGEIGGSTSAMSTEFVVVTFTVTHADDVVGN